MKFSMQTREDIDLLGTKFLVYTRVWSKKNYNEPAKAPYWGLTL